MDSEAITAVILAGGRGSRLNGQDKGLVKIAGRPMISFVIDALRGQAADIIISANRHLPEYAEFGLPVLKDSVTGYPGPLAGILTALEHCATDYLLTVPCDAPLLDDNFAGHMLQRLTSSNADACVAESHGRWQPVHTLLHTRVRESAEKAIDRNDLAMHSWLKTLNTVTVDFTDSAEQFENLNNEIDRQRLQQLLTCTNN